MGGDVTRVGNAGSPGSDGASPYQELRSFASHARATREAPVRTEPHPHQSQNKTASQITRKTIGIKTGALTPRN
jgi:hypothetical protein